MLRIGWGSSVITTHSSLQLSHFCRMLCRLLRDIDSPCTSEQKKEASRWLDSGKS